MSVISRAPVAPILADASLRSEQVTQLVLGETAAVLERRGDWLRVRGDADAYEGWVHAGYVLEVDRQRAAAWRASAQGWSDGAMADGPTGWVQLPLRARVILEHGGLRLPGGSQARLLTGVVRTMDDVMRTSRALSPDVWAWHAFGGAPYLWGGVSPAGVDCSGLVQTTFAARGISLPRDAWQQAAVGEAVAALDLAPGDLCFFRGETTERITHVAIYAGDHVILHSTVRCGMVVRERWTEGAATELRDRLVGVRRVKHGA